MSALVPGAEPGRPRALTLVAARGADERAFLPAALEIIETPASPAGRAIGLLIITIAAVALTWAAVSKVDIVTTAPGRVVPIGRSKILQPFAAGIVVAIEVADGDRVQAGQPLIVLDPTMARADATRAAQDVLELNLDRARLQGLRMALTTGAAPSLQDTPSNATADERAATNAQMQAQAAEESGKLADLAQQIAEKRFEGQQAAASIAKVQTDRPFLAEIAGMRTELLHEQVGSKLDWLTAQEQLAATGPDVVLAQAQEDAAIADVASLQQQRAVTAAQYSNSVLGDLRQATQKIDESAQDLVKADDQLALTVLRAPISGTVQQLAVHTVGGVVTPAESLLTVVPDNQRLMVEASIKNQDIGFVYVGQTARVKIGAFDFTRFGTIDGTVMSISRDVVDQSPYQPPQDDGYDSGAQPQSPADSATKNPAQPEPQYLAHIALSRTAIETDQGTALLKPGMAVTADIKTGRRSVLSYLLTPITQVTSDSMHER